MGFIVPNASDVPVLDQAEVDSQDYRALGDRSTGVLSGGAVSAQTIPSMSVQVAAGQAIIDGLPVSFDASSLSVQPSASTSRFDLVVVRGNNALAVIRGTASANPVFPTLDTSSEALLAAIFVEGGTATITNANIVRKDIAMEPSFRRFFGNDADTFLSSSAPAGSMAIRADGEISWGSNVLRRTAAAAMEFVTTLKVRAAEAANAVLVVQARQSNPDTQRALDITSSSGTTVASISGSGVLTAANFVRGVGSPEGVATAPKGTLYIDIDGSSTEMAWIKTAGAGNTGWRPLKITNPGDETFPTGTVIGLLGSDTPAGWLTCHGQPISTSDPVTAPLAGVVGNRYGAGAGFVNLPDLRGYILIGEGGDLGLGIGQFAGALAHQLSIANLPIHDHAVTDPGHAHPQHARMLVYGPTGGAHPDGPLGWSVEPEPAGFDRVATTGITVEPAGAAEPFMTVPPVHAVNWVVKL